MRVVALFLLVSGTALLAKRAWIEVKAIAAEALIERAFDAHLSDGRPHRPWAWADLCPVARLEVARLGVSRFVLSGASGSSMAFGVGHIDGTAPPNGEGNCVLAGHRDRWMAFLADLKRGDIVQVRTAKGSREYVVDHLEVVHQDATAVLDRTDADRLTLITCYPFGGLVRSPLRYVVGCAARA